MLQFLKKFLSHDAEEIKINENSLGNANEKLSENFKIEFEDQNFPKMKNQQSLDSDLVKIEIMDEKSVPKHY